jgi:hypothetical protein
MNEQDRWKNRRKMAWLCMIAAIGYPLLVLGTNSRELGEIAIPFYMFVSAVVGAYIGFATVDDHWQKQDRFKGGYSKDWRNDLYDQDYSDRRRY